MSDSRKRSPREPSEYSHSSSEPARTERRPTLSGPGDQSDLDRGYTPEDLRSQWVDNMINRVSHQHLKQAFREVFSDKIAGDVAMQALLRNARKSAKEESRAIIIAADNIREKVLDEAKNRSRALLEAAGGGGGQKGGSSDVAVVGGGGVGDLPHKIPLGPRDLCARLVPFLHQAIGLCYLGHLVDGPMLAWKCLLAVARFAVHNWERSFVHVAEDDGYYVAFHSQVDDYLLEVCEAQKDYGHMTWLGDQARKDVLELKNALNEGPYEYEYDRTMDFLEDCQNEIMKQDINLNKRSIRKSLGA